ncbi:MAG: hypothetical protein LUG56_05085, partial [Lachnospiraceae bacterium]|nr:hypothetical protein [Lachnospiraceae bacterium]
MALWKKGKNPQDAQKESQDWEELSFEDGEFEDEEYADEGGEVLEAEYADADGDVAEAEYADADGDVTEAEYADGIEAESTVGEEDFDLIFTDEDFAENLADDTAESLTDNTADSFADETAESFSDQRAGSYEVNAAAFGNITRKEEFVITGEPTGENMDTEEPDEEEVLTEEAYEEESYAGEAYAEEPYAEEPYAEELYAEEPYATEAPVSQDGEDHFSDGLRIMDLDGQEDKEEEDDSFGAFFTKFVSGRMLAISSFLVLAVFIVAAAVIVTGRGSQSVDAFSTVSSDLEDVDVIGGEALAALMASKDEEYQATLLASEQTETTVSKEYEETETTTEKITVKLVMPSVEKDLKIKFTNASTGK